MGPRYAVSKTAAYASSSAASIMVASSFQLGGSERVEYWGDQRPGAGWDLAGVLWLPSIAVQFEHNNLIQAHIAFDQVLVVKHEVVSPSLFGCESEI